jgi:hypothetical protein
MSASRLSGVNTNSSGPLTRSLPPPPPSQNQQTNAFQEAGLNPLHASSSSSSPPRCALLEQPAEMLQSVYRCLDPRDVMTLREVSKTIRRTLPKNLQQSALLQVGMRNNKFSTDEILDLVSPESPRLRPMRNG